MPDPRPAPPSRLFRADWVLPVDAPAIAGGAVRTRAGRIESTGPSSRLPPLPGEEVTDLPGAILLPAFVNSHSHLEYSLFGGLFPPSRFLDWLFPFLRLKERLSPEEFALNSLCGALESAASGFGTVADHCDRGSVPAALGAVGLRGVVYQEVFGPLEGDAESSLSEALRKIELLRASAPPLVRIGITPHSTYTSSAPLLRAVAERARRDALPLSIHADESDAERDFLRAGTGPLAEAWAARGRPWSPPGCSAVRYLEGLGFLEGTRAQLVHLVHASPDDLSLLAAAGAGAAFCPRSNAFLRQPDAPLAHALARGVATGLGTDSPASGGSLDPRHDLRRARALLGIPEGACAPADALRLIRLVTLDAARSIGLDERIGSLAPGKDADLVAIRPDLDPDRSAGEEEPHVLAARHLGQPWVILTVVGGEVACERRMPEEEHWAFPRLGLGRGFQAREEGELLRKDLERRLGDP